MAHYYAPKIKKNWLKIIGWRILIPPILLLDFLKWGINYLLGRRVGSLVLPAQSMNFSDWLLNDPRAGEDMDGLIRGEFHKIICDHCELDTYELYWPSQRRLPANQQKYIIYFHGNGMCYEQAIDRMQADALALGCNVVGFNYRGVAKSSGRAYSEQDLVADGIAQVQRLLDNGIDPQNITLRGRSLGGGIATLVAYHLHQQNQKVYLFNETSFSNITNTVIGWIRKIGSNADTGFKTGGLGIALGILAWPIVKIFLILTKWDIPVENAYNELPESHKEYIVVRSSKQRRAEDNAVLDDPVIPHYASLHLTQKPFRRKKKRIIDEARAKVNKQIPTAEAKLQPQLKQQEAELAEERKRLKTKKMEVYPKCWDQDGHNIDRQHLISRYDQTLTAVSIFRNFVKRKPIYSRDQDEKKLDSIESDEKISLTDFLKN